MKRLLCVFILLLLTACGQQKTIEPPEQEISPSKTQTEPEYPPEDDSIRAAALEGEPLSPDGRFLARVKGHSEGAAAAGLYPADTVQITDAETGKETAFTPNLFSGLRGEALPLWPGAPELGASLR